MSTKRDAPPTEDEWQTVQPSKKRKKKDARKAAQAATPAISFSPNLRLQSFVSLRDLQSLPLYILADGPSPRWLAVNRTKIDRVVVLMVPGLDIDIFNDSDMVFNGNSTVVKQTNEGNVTPDDYYPTGLHVDKGLPEYLEPLSHIFTHRWPIRSPGDDKGMRLWSSSRAMLSCPIQQTKEEKKNKDSAKTDLWCDTPTSITTFIASREALEDNEYIVHPSLYTSDKDRQTVFEKRKESKTHPDNGWVDTLLKKHEIAQSVSTDALLDGKYVISIDCEMCLTHEDQFVLTRISVVNWDQSVVFDELVKPADPIKDYLTPYSGITKEMLEPVTTSLVDIQEKLLSIISDDTIIIGHSLNSDFNALKITHPHVVDTSILYPHIKGPPLRNGLKFLTQKYLNRAIQASHGTSGHDSIEDARAVLDLVKLKCQKGPKFGDSTANEEPLYKRLGKMQRRYTPEGSNVPSKESTTEEITTKNVAESIKSAHVDREGSRNNYNIYADFSARCTSDSEVVNTVAEVLASDGPITGDADFVWARLRELEASRGWRRGSVTQSPNKGTKDGNSPAAANGSTTSLTTKEAVKETVSCITKIYDSLPAQTAFIVYSGAADQREVWRLQNQQQQFKREYQVKKWDELSVRWTDYEEQALRAACKRARTGGLGFVTVKPAQPS